MTDDIDQRANLTQDTNAFILKKYLQATAMLFVFLMSKVVADFFHKSRFHGKIKF